jgi:hypothetical protein
MYGWTPKKSATTLFSFPSLVIPAKAGISLAFRACGYRDSRLHGNDVVEERLNDLNHHFTIILHQKGGAQRAAPFF